MPRKPPTPRQVIERTPPRDRASRAAAPALGVTVEPLPRDRDELSFARSIIQAEGRALRALSDSLDDSFVRALDLIEKCACTGGTVQVSGLGKSGHVGAKISATFASLGIPSNHVHPSEAAHGDLGRFRPNDLAICISFSGETDEVVNLAAILRQDGMPIIAITGGTSQGRASKAVIGAGAREPAETPALAKSSLQRLATVSLTLGIDEEAGAPDFVAPTSSTTATLALGDALALSVARRRNFTNHDFAKRHPGGSLGGLLRPVVDVMRWRAGVNLPMVDASLSVLEALRRAESSVRRPGALVLVDREGVLVGIFTDGDLRRLVQRDAAAVARPIAEVMTRTPRTLPETARVSDAVRLIREFRQDEVPIVDRRGRPVGMLDVQDLVAMRLVEQE